MLRSILPRSPRHCRPRCRAVCLALGAALVVAALVAFDVDVMRHPLTSPDDDAARVRLAGFATSPGGGGAETLAAARARAWEQIACESRAATLFLPQPPACTFTATPLAPTLFNATAPSAPVVPRFCAALPLPRAWSARHAGLRSRSLYIALNLFNAEDVLPDLAATLLAVLSRVDAGRSFVAVYENGSGDRTKAMLRDLARILRALRVGHSVVLDAHARPWWAHRIAYLAGVRNQALAPLRVMAGIDLPPPVTAPRAQRLEHLFDPLTGATVATAVGPSPPKFDRILFLNDVYACPEDVLEAVHQAVARNATLACGLDYGYPAGARTPQFYDTWVARDTRGGVWEKGDGDHMFPADTAEAHAVKRQAPFAAYCCWNGGAVLDPAPFVAGLQFRRDTRGCSGSECSTLCRDLAAYARDHGDDRARTLVVPRLKVAYHPWVFGQLKDPFGSMVRAHGLRPMHLDGDGPSADGDDGEVEFALPPERSYCIPMYRIGNRHPEGPDFWEDLSELRQKRPRSQ
ncbi:hypothetical protein H9P43_004558 [Blastocladiella emersonii ATCC 22665]|nr:hypothetical protein H9P43_004558 [Blastocladiella emersonii ATCC 22665]